MLKDGDGNVLETLVVDIGNGVVQDLVLASSIGQFTSAAKVGFGG